MRKGFTLIELLIVVLIIAILAAIAVPNFLEFQTRAKVSRTKSDLRVMATGIEAYYVDWNIYPRDTNDDLDLRQKNGTGGLTGNGTVDQPYCIDITNDDFVQCANGSVTLTTPISYLNTILNDPFAPRVNINGLGRLTYMVGSGSWSYTEVGFNSDYQDSNSIFWATSPPSPTPVARVGNKPTWVAIGVGPDTLIADNYFLAFPAMPATPGASTLLLGGLYPAQPNQFTDYDPTNGTVSLGDVHRFGGAWRSAGKFMLNGERIGGGASTQFCTVCW